MNRQEAINKLQSHRAEIQRLGVLHIALFGSSARGEQNDRSDIDLAVRLDARRKLGLLRLVEIEQQIGEMLGTRVDLVTEPGCASRLQSQIDRDRIDVF
jgi:predicted nucleotidyltransferase